MSFQVQKHSLIVEKGDGNIQINLLFPLHKSLNKAKKKIWSVLVHRQLIFSDDYFQARFEGVVLSCVNS